MVANPGANMNGHIGKYEIQAELGRGAFGRVFRAYDPKVGRLVAIKVLAAEQDSDLLGRFHSEAGTTGNLRHKNIVTVYEYGEHEGLPYIVMELLEGRDLQHIIDKHEPLTLLEKISIMAQVAEGLHCAHQNHIVHRDIKPANIMVSVDGTAKIMDFGIARVTGRDGTRRTRQGDIIGTILYMAPERLRGGEGDELADIFAYGVIYYELLTGVHPFHAGDPGSTMYRITSLDPQPVRELFPECPEPLAAVVTRTLAKDREKRYQSVEDIIFDCRPIMMELQHQRAAVILEEARELMAAGALQRATEKVRQVMQLDPANREARQLREQLQHELQRQLISERVRVLLEEGDHCLARRAYTEAIERYESALRLDNSDPLCRMRLERAQSALEDSRRAAHLLSDARREIQQGNLTTAYSLVSDALRTDSDNPEAVAVRDELLLLIEKRDKERRIRSALYEAQELSLRHDYDAALAVLEPVVAQYPEEASLSSMQERLTGLRAEHIRKTVEARAAKIRQALQRNLREAIRLLEEFAAEFPQESVLGALRREVQEKLAAEQRTQAIEKLTSEAMDLLNRERFDDACRALDAGLKAWPHEQSLQRLLQNARDLQASHERAKVVAALIRDARQLRQEGNLRRALDLVTGALREFGNETAVIELKRQLEFEEEQERYRAGLRRVLEEGRALLGQNRAGEAVAVLEKAVETYPHEGELASLLANAQQAKAARDEQDFVNETLAAVRDLENSRKLRQALEKTEGALARYPTHPLLGMAAERLRAAVAAEIRREELARHVRAIEQAIASGNWDGAAEALRHAHEKIPGEDALERLDAKLRQRRLESEVESLVKDVQRCIGNGDLNGAAGRLASAGPSVCSHPVWRDLQRQLKARQDDEAALLKAEELTRHQDYAAAEDLLRGLCARDVPDPRAASMLKAVKAKRQQMEDDRAVEQGLYNANALVEKGDLTGGIAVLEQLASEFPKEAAVQTLRRDLQDRLTARQAIEALIREAAALIKNRRFEEACRILEPGAQKYPDHPDLQRLLQNAREFQASHERVTAVAACIGEARRLRQEGQLRRAIDLVTGALRNFGDETALIELKQQLELEDARQRELAARRKVLEDARTLLTRKRVDEAIVLLERAVSLYPNDVELATLLESTKRAKAAEDEQSFVNDVLAAVRELENKRKVREALDKALSAQIHYPANPLLGLAVERLREAVAAEDHRERLARHVRIVEDAIAARNWQGAAAALRRAQEELPGEDALERLDQKIRQGRLESELESLIKDVQQCFTKDDLDGAARRLAAAGPSVREHPVWRDLQSQLKTRQDDEAALKEAEALIAGGRHDAAEDVLRRLSAKGARDRRAAAMLKTILAERQRKERERVVQEALQAAEALAQRDLAAAIAVLDHLPAESARDDRIVALRREFERRLEAQRLEAERLRQEQAAQKAADEASARARLDKATIIFRPEETAAEPFPAQQGAAAAPQPKPAASEPETTPTIAEPPPPEPEPRRRLLKKLLPAAAALAAAIVTYWLVTRPPAAPSASPRELAFVYRSGDGDPEPQEIEWRNVETRFSAKTNQPWVVVTPSEGSKLTRLRVQVIPKDLPVGTRTAEIVVTPSRGALVTVPVRLEIIDSRIEADTKPGSPPPVALRVRPERLDFNHRLGTAGRPFSQTIVILQGAVANVQVTPSRESRWLRHSREGAGIRVEVMPEELGEGAYQAVLVLSGTDPSLSARVAVNLRVDPPVAVPRPKSAETPPGGPGCAAGPLYAATEGAFTWNGELAPGSAVVVNYNGVSSGGGWLSGNTPPDRFALEVKVLAGNVEVSSPSSANGCAPLRIANRGAAPVTSFRLQWKIVPAENRY